MRAYIKLIDRAIKLGYTVSVYDGECWSTKRSINKQQIIEDVDGVDEAQLRFRNTAGGIVGWALVSCDNCLEDDETVIDYSCSIDDWNS